MTPSSATVAVNMLWCVPGQVGGSEDYLVRLLLGLAEHGADAGLSRVDVYGPQGLRAAHPELAEACGIVEAPIDGRARVARVWAEHTWLVQRTRGVDLIHHGGGTVPARRPPGARALLTLHDLQYLTYPQYFSRTKLAYLRHAVPRSVRRADAITVPTAFVRDTVVDGLGVDPERIVVVPHGVPPFLGHGATAEQVLRERYSLGKAPVVVLAAITHPHKGHAFLLRLVHERWTDPDLRVVLIGGEGAAEGDVAAAIDRLGLRGRVVRTGRVPAADRDGLLLLADALVFPSEYEGFGAPVLEAMALGTPVITSDRTCLPEVVAGAGLCLPLDLDAWAPALDEVRRRRAELVEAGMRRAADFSARAAAGQLLTAYRLALR